MGAGEASQNCSITTSASWRPARILVLTPKFQDGLFYGIIVAIANPFLLSGCNSSAAEKGNQYTVSSARKMIIEFLCNNLAKKSRAGLAKWLSG